MTGIVDPRRALLALLNVGIDDINVSARIQNFIKTFGPLRDPRVPGDRDPEYLHTPEQTVFGLVRLFTSAICSVALPEEQHRFIVNRNLGLIFNDSVTIECVTYQTALDVDIVEGTVEPTPRDLLDAMALELLRSRKEIARCGICDKFFYRQFSKDKFCSHVCTAESRRRTRLDWARKKAGEKKQSHQRTEKGTEH